MTKKMKIGMAATIIVVMAILAVGLVAASKNYVSPEGKWQLTGGEAYEALEGMTKVTYEFRTFKKLLVTVETEGTSETVTGSWDVEIYDLHIKLDGETTVCDYEVADDTLTIVNEDGSTMVFTRAAG